MPDTLEDKAAAILRDGRLTVQRCDKERDGWVVARCQGLTGEYMLGWDAITKSWRCTCAELRGNCSHLLALKLVIEDWKEVDE